MGDRNAVEFGQQAHVQLCLAVGLRLQDMLTLRGSLPRQEWCAGVMIDDLILLEKTSVTSDAKLVTTAIADALVEAYASVGLEAHEGKRMRATGGEVLGCSGEWDLRAGQSSIGTIGAGGLHHQPALSIRVGPSEVVGGDRWCLGLHPAVPTPRNVCAGECVPRHLRPRL